MRSGGSSLLLFATAALLLVAAGRTVTSASAPPAAPAPPAGLRGAAPRGDNCLTCHFGIEDMHPWQELSCVDCHGGDPTAETKELAHVAPAQRPPNDERVLPRDFDPDYLRFQNPSDLRVTDRTCGQCHATACADLMKSLHGTTAGHLSDGMYEAGLFAERGSRYGVFRVEADEQCTSEDSLERLLGLPSFDPKAPRGDFASHYRDLPPKNCVRCHLWAPGVAVRGRLGLDGDYRAHGCAACHVTYADDGLAKGGDPTIDRFEPGHPLRHELTTKIPTETCTRCHYGDASIGLNFRGLAQLYPGQPAGPDVPGTTDARLNQTFYVDDYRVVPPDVHHENGMHCIDCHTVRDVMGDGNLYGQMPAAVEIECVDCHGTFTRAATGLTSRGNPLDHLVKEGGRYFLISKVTGERHPVKQAAHVTNPRHPDHNPRAAEAMKPEHERLECYACHGGWSPNFFGFHFDRNEQFTQLDLMTGERTPGRVTTQEKVFATFRGLYLGWNSEERIAPYMVGFSSMGSVHDASGRTILDQVMPVTQAGLSGMTLIHHQLHTNRKQARDCADCHRNPTALGLGSPNSNFRLARRIVLVGSSRGLDVLSLDRKRPADSLPLATLPLLGVRHVTPVEEPLQGAVQRAYVATAGRGVLVVDLANPAFPIERGALACEDPRATVVAADRLYVAGGRGGVMVCDVKEPFAPKVLAVADLPDARDVHLFWPHLYVADHELGLVILDVTDPARPQRVAVLDLAADEGGTGRALDLAMLLLPSRPDDGRGMGKRAPSRVLAALACDDLGLRVADVSEPREPVLLRAYDFVGGMRRGVAATRVTAVAALSKVDLGSPDGGIPTEENDYLLATVVSDNYEQGRMLMIRVTDPHRPRSTTSARVSPFAASLAVANVYNPPFLQTIALVAGGDELVWIDISRSNQFEGLAQFGGLRGARSVAVESMPLDRLVDEAGTPWKDISHEGARYFSRLEIDKILRAPVPVRRGAQGPETPGSQERQGSR